MSYIGKEPSVGNFIKLDAITCSSTNTYNLLNGGVAFTPESVNHMLVSLNGVIQSPTTAYTVSGSQITFIPSSGTLSSSDVIDFIMVYGNVLDIGVPSDNTVTAGKLATDSVQTAKIVDDAVTKAKVNFISDSTAGVEVKGDGGSNDGYIQLNCSQNSHGVKIKSPPHSAGQSYTLTLPSSITNDYYLKTDGSGNLSFAQVSSDCVKIASTQVTSGVAQVDFNSTIMSSDYKYFELNCRNVSGSGSDIDLEVKISVDNGSTFLVSFCGLEYNQLNGTSRGYNNFTDKHRLLEDANTGSGSVNYAQFKLFQSEGGSNYNGSVGWGVTRHANNGNYYYYTSGCYWLGTGGAINFIRVIDGSGGNIDDGTFDLYGYK